MKNNEAPFHVGQRVVCISDKPLFGPALAGYIIKKRDECNVVGIYYYPGRPEWGPYVEVDLHPGAAYARQHFAPIREVRDHKSIAVPEELLHITERDTLEPVKIKV